MKTYTNVELMTLTHVQRVQLLGIALVVVTAIVSGHHAVGYIVGGVLYALGTLVKILHRRS